MASLIPLLNQSLGGYLREAMAAYRAKAYPKTTHTERFVLFGRGRTGSTLLSDLLNQSTDIDCDKEIYNRKVLFPKLFLKHRNRVFRSKVYGFKLLSYQLREKLGQEDGRDFLKYLVEKQGYKLIYLTRDNLVRQTLSKHYARFRMSWHETQSLKSRPKMRVDIPAFMTELRAGKELEQYEEKCLEGLNYFKVSYEKDLMKASDRFKLVDRLYHYLGVRLFKPENRLKRISADRIGDFVENWEALKQCLAYTEFEDDLKNC